MNCSLEEISLSLFINTDMKVLSLKDYSMMPSQKNSNSLTLSLMSCISQKSL